MIEILYDYDENYDKTRILLSTNGKSDSGHLRVYILNDALTNVCEPISITVSPQEERPLLCVSNADILSTLPIVHNCTNGEQIKQGYNISAIAIETTDEDDTSVRLFMIDAPIRWKYISKKTQPYFKRDKRLAEIEKLFNIKIFLPCTYIEKIKVEDDDSYPYINPREYTVAKANIEYFLHRINA